MNNYNVYDNEVGQLNIAPQQSRRYSSTWKTWLLSQLSSAIIVFQNKALIFGPLIALVSYLALRDNVLYLFVWIYRLLFALTLFNVAWHFRQLGQWRLAFGAKSFLAFLAPLIHSRIGMCLHQSGHFLASDENFLLLEHFKSTYLRIHSYFIWKWGILAHGRRSSSQFLFFVLMGMYHMSLEPFQSVVERIPTLQATGTWTRIFNLGYLTATLCHLVYLVKLMASVNGIPKLVILAQALVTLNLLGQGVDFWPLNYCESTVGILAAYTLDSLSIIAINFLLRQGGYFADGNGQPPNICPDGDDDEYSD